MKLKIVKIFQLSTQSKRCKHFYTIELRLIKKNWYSYARQYPVNMYHYLIYTIRKE